MLNVSYLTRGPRTISPLQKRMGFTKLLLVSAGIGWTRKLVVRELVRTCTVPSHAMHLHAICRPTKSRKRLIDFHLVNCFLLQLCLCLRQCYCNWRLQIVGTMRHKIFVVHLLHLFSCLALVWYPSSPHTDVIVGRRRFALWFFRLSSALMVRSMLIPLFVWCITSARAPTKTKDNIVRAILAPANI